MSSSPTIHTHTNMHTHTNIHMCLLLHVALEQDWCEGMHQRETHLEKHILRNTYRETHIVILLYLSHGPSDIRLFLSYDCVRVRVWSLCKEIHGRVYVRTCMI